jgi:protein-S-isoprenylcysteine O-methyltransferase Ste14
MPRGLVTTIIVLPGTVLVFVPLVILLVAPRTNFPLEPASPAGIRFWLALASGIIGLVLSAWTVRLFVKLGKGTPAPWDPPERLVVRGPYRHVRNPMITGALLLLLAEAIYLRSLAVAGWIALFFVGNAIYFPLVEEKDLEKRFGADYRNYKANVPRWLPRLRPWGGVKILSRGKEILVSEQR